MLGSCSKIEALEKEIEALKTRLPMQTPSVSRDLDSAATDGIQLTCPLLENESPVHPAKGVGPSAPGISPILRASSSVGSPGSASIPSILERGVKRKWSCFETETPTAPDLCNISGLATEELEMYFNAFFFGCDRYVPIFDPRYDHVQGVRSRSGLLFTTICSVGCRVLHGTDSQHWRVLSFHNQRMLNAVIANPDKGSLEAVQALLVRACYAPERSLLISIATRIALGLEFPEAYDTLSGRFISRAGQQSDQHNDSSGDDAMLMRKARTWLHLLVMGHILHVDAGGLPTFRFRGAARRCRILLQSAFSTKMDHYLFAQVELNVLRAKIYASLYQLSNVDDQELMDLVRDAKIDIDIWFNDWKRISEKHHQEMPWFVSNLSIQRCWADSMALCRAVRASGVENVDAMSLTQRSILLMAKDSLKQHLDTIVQEPRAYLDSLRYAMDFVWAKNTFCCLLLLKLSILLPDEDQKRSRDFSQELIEKSTFLLDELDKAAGEPKKSARSSTNALYLQLLKVSIQKYRQELNPCQYDCHNASRHTHGWSLNQEATWRPHDRQETDLESFVPEQFVFEWDFPGLTLFSSPLTEISWFENFLAGTQESGDDLFSVNWESMDFAL
ncbi:hypothetical protein FZEAL_5094 [Fusarium zealandicum]|uniref:Transcription factor domain-containing protein n=1 Tax=Fusarium zealandicum TaxID=1053134 RepID=A0A8H4UKJ2_9HYPO|nr:hypothetical protein FZEAL_5094 [Fusarium zealandicum]